MSNRPGGRHACMSWREIVRELDDGLVGSAFTQKRMRRVETSALRYAPGVSVVSVCSLAVLGMHVPSSCSDAVSWRTFPRKDTEKKLRIDINNACPLSTVLNGSSHSPTALNGAPSTPNGFSNGPATSSTASLPTQQLPPACGARQLCKLKRFLTTLQQFGNDISPEIGERVRSLVLGLVVSTR